MGPDSFLEVINYNERRAAVMIARAFNSFLGLQQRSLLLYGKDKKGKGIRLSRISGMAICPWIRIFKSQNITHIELTPNTQSLNNLPSLTKFNQSFNSSQVSNIKNIQITIIFLQISSISLQGPSPKNCPSNNFIYKMQINFSNFEENLSRRDKKDLYCRPLTALISTHTRTHTTDEVFNPSLLARRRENHGYTTRVTTSDKKAYRNIRSASLYETLYPQLPQDRPCKLQVINNTCFKKVFMSKGRPFRRGSTVYDVNATLSQHITQQDHTKKQNQLPKYHCKKLKVIKGKPKIVRIHSEVNNQEDAWSKAEGVAIIGTKIL